MPSCILLISWRKLRIRRNSTLPRPETAQRVRHALATASRQANRVEGANPVDAAKQVEETGTVEAEEGAAGETAIATRTVRELPSQRHNSRTAGMAMLEPTIPPIHPQ
jgi:hypothetical protein